MYKRFVSIDRDGNGYLTQDEVCLIPEFAVNPFKERLCQVFSGTLSLSTCGPWRPPPRTEPERAEWLTTRRSVPVFFVLSCATRTLSCVRRVQGDANIR